jgi:hypothetical protein
LFERAPPDAGHQSVFFLICTFLAEKGDHKFNDSKNAPKMGVCVGKHNKKRSLIKKRTLLCPASRRALSNKKKFKYIDRAPTEKFWTKGQKIINREKRKNIFRFFKKLAYFSSSG